MATETPRNLIWKHIRAIGTCMMVTQVGDKINARPMRSIPRPEQNAIWFFADVETFPNDETEKEQGTCLTFADVKSNTYVSVTGTLRRVLDRDSMVDLWNEDADSYFKNGPDDPKVVLLRFDPDSGHYWDAPSSAIVIAIKFIEAKILGGRPEVGTSGRARLS